MEKPSSVLLAVWGLLCLRIARSQKIDPIQNMCLRLDHQSVVKNNTLYIDGGRATFADDPASNAAFMNITQGYNNYLITIDLSKPWDTTQNITEHASTRGTIYHGSDPDDNFYVWGGTTSSFNTSFPGYRPPYPAQYSLWSYNITSQEWGQFDLSSGSANRPSAGSFAESREQNLGFYFNGQLDSGSSSETTALGNSSIAYLEGMIVIDLNARTARNLSTKAVVGDMPRSRGRMQYIKQIGPNGILVQIGGNQKNVTDYSNDNVGNLVSMAAVDIFDISSLFNSSTPEGMWYKQNTTGDIPESRIDFCTVLASSDDSTSNNIYVYGGRGASHKYFDDVYVLSLPSFTWTKIYEGSSPRYGHTCHRIGNSTMLSVGGAANVDFSSGPCDFERKGVGVFDMSHANWTVMYSPKMGPYTVPEAVVARIGATSEDGGARANKPGNGWGSDGLASLFNAAWNPRPTGANADDTNSSDSSASSASATPATSTTPAARSSSSPNTKTWLAPLIGGLVSGLGLLAILFALTFIFRRALWSWFFPRDGPPDAEGRAGSLSRLSLATAAAEPRRPSREADDNPLAAAADVHKEMDVQSFRGSPWRPGARVELQAREDVAAEMQGWQCAIALEMEKRRREDDGEDDGDQRGEHDDVSANARVASEGAGRERGWEEETSRRKDSKSGVEGGEVVYPSTWI